MAPFVSSVTQTEIGDRTHLRRRTRRLGLVEMTTHGAAGRSVIDQDFRHLFQMRGGFGWIF